MDRPLGCSGSYGVGGGVVSSGGSATGPISTASKEDEIVLSSEGSSSLSEESDVELGLGLSLGCGGAVSTLKTAQYARTFTVEDLPSLASRMSSSSFSTSGIKANNTTCGSKRSADSFPSPRSSGVSRVVGWPPVRASRMNSLVNQAKSPVSDDCNSTHARSKVRNIVPDRSERSKKDDSAKCPKTSLFVKVNMDGMPIGRKVDLGAHTCYETLVHTLDDMFCKRGIIVNARSSYSEEDGAITDPSHPTESLMLLDEASEYAFTYEDKDGDWMLVGDVPWEMFINSVKRLRIMKRWEANGLAPRSPEPNERGRSKHI